LDVYIMDLPSPALPLSSFANIPAFNVKAVCLRTGITAATLRAWERRYGLPNPERTPNGYRLYSERDLAIIIWLMQQTQAGIAIGQAVQQLVSIIYQKQEVYVRIANKAQQSSISVPRSPALLTNDLLDAFLNFDERAANKAINEASALFTIETTLTQTVLPALRAAYGLAQSREASLSMYRFGVSFARQWVLTLIQNVPMPKNRESVVTIGFSGENHELEVLILGLMLRRSGWPVTHLGADLGPEILISRLDNINAVAVLYYIDSPQHAERLVGFPPPINRNGHAMWCVVAGEALENRPELQGRIPFEYLGADLRDVVQCLTRRLEDRYRPARIQPAYNTPRLDAPGRDAQGD
jgi:MerR family transcriptional regulator, light-induced transcriptional regulator